MLISPNKGETAVHGCHCPGDMVVRMRTVLAIPRGWYVCLSADECCIENTANQKARDPLHILRYATGNIPRKNPVITRGLQRLLYI